MLGGMNWAFWFWISILLIGVAGEGVYVAQWWGRLFEQAADEAGEDLDFG